MVFKRTKLTFKVPFFKLDTDFQLNWNKPSIMQPKFFQRYLKDIFFQNYCCEIAAVFYYMFRIKNRFFSPKGGPNFIVIHYLNLRLDEVTKSLEISVISFMVSRVFYKKCQQRTMKYVYFTVKKLIECNITNKY